VDPCDRRMFWLNLPNALAHGACVVVTVGMVGAGMVLALTSSWWWLLLVPAAFILDRLLSGPGPRLG
jgi:hypothetical protein